jgi:uncharacterized protein
MQIRSVTLFAEPGFSPERAVAFFEQGRRAFPAVVQTTRAALPPFPAWLGSLGDPVAGAVALERAWRGAGADYLNLGPVRLADGDEWLDLVPPLVEAGQDLFASAEVADGRGRLDPARCLAVADIVRRLSLVRTDGFGNVYFCAAANCGPGIPFFPVAYHGGGPPAFALAIEAADLAVEAVQAAASLEEARETLVAAVEREAGELARAAGRLAAEHKLPFLGLDFTLAPYPEQARSIGRALEGLGLSPLGGPGSLFAAAFLTEAVGRARFPRCGFSGLMFPVLEDGLLALRHAQGALGASELLTYAAVCGAGIDLLPLPGDVSLEALAGLLLDVGALALRLNKPLTARLMPLPGLQAGDPVHFDFDYFADGRVAGLPSVALGPSIRGAPALELRSVTQDEGRDGG